MPSIKNSDFVKSRHILNIVSESAKIAIRDYIDNLTIRTNDKVEKIAADITQKVLQKFTEAGKQISVLLQIKQDVMNLAE
jgi:NAD+--asparagine ADP-ribosyltransferase